MASAIHVSASVSTTAGGVPRVCRTPGITCTAAYGGTRTSTEWPGARSSRTARKCLVSSRRSARSGRRRGPAPGRPPPRPGRPAGAGPPSGLPRLVGEGLHDLEDLVGTAAVVVARPGCGAARRRRARRARRRAACASSLVSRTACSVTERVDAGRAVVAVGLVDEVVGPGRLGPPEHRGGGLAAGQPSRPRRAGGCSRPPRSPSRPGRACPGRPRGPPRPGRTSPAGAGGSWPSWPGSRAAPATSAARSGPAASSSVRIRLRTG